MVTLTRNPWRREGIFAVVALICVIFDQVTKVLATMYLQPAEPVPFIPGVLDLMLVRNTGAAFSIGEGYSWLFALIAVAVVVALAWGLWVSDDLPVFLCIFAGVLAGGGIGNLIDRLFRGSVVDFFATSFMDFPVFNVADICVDVGVIAGFIGMLWWDHRQELARRAEGPADGAGE